MRLLMCPPDYYGIYYEINPWMSVLHQADREEAKKQWNTLHRTLLDLGVHVDLLPPVKGLPDLVFTANVGLFYRGQVVLPRFFHPERRGELTPAQLWFQQNGFHVESNFDEEMTPFFEGEGDALFDGERLFAGYGFRTQREFYEKNPIFSGETLIFAELVNPYFYHLDTCFCPLNSTFAMWYPAAFSSHSQEALQRATSLIEVREEEARRFACNAVVVDRHVVLPDGCPFVTQQLEEHGFTVHAVPMSEFMKAGGACKCLCLWVG